MLLRACPRSCLPGTALYAAAIASTRPAAFDGSYWGPAVQRKHIVLTRGGGYIAREARVRAAFHRRTHTFCNFIRVFWRVCALPAGVVQRASNLAGMLAAHHQKRKHRGQEASPARKKRPSGTAPEDRTKSAAPARRLGVGPFLLVPEDQGRLCLKRFKAHKLRLYIYYYTLGYDWQ